MSTSLAKLPFPVRLFFLGALYLVQGLPFGVQANVIPLLLRRAGTSLEAIGFAGLLALPWMVKVFIGPTVDAYHHPALGRRRTWILPLQVGLGLSALGAATIDPTRDLGILMVLVLAMNACAAFMDVAVDGLAIDVLRPDELGPGNAAQVVGYKLGMLTSGGLLVAYVGTLGWSGLFYAVAAIAAVVFALTLLVREPETSADAAPTKVMDVLRALLASAKRPGALWVLAFIATYKLGESAADAMFKPFLVDEAYSDEQIGLWIGTWGTALSLAGSLLGGVAVVRMRLVVALALAALLRAGPIVGEWALATYGTSDASVIAVTCAEHFFGGALTTVMFAFMMSQVDRSIGATHYTALATVEVLGKAPAGLLSGVIARHLGYAGVFGIGAILSVAFLGLLVPVARAQRIAH
ncbi:MAG: MFS transporter [Sandaracinaceae bacterium]